MGQLINVEVDELMRFKQSSPNFNNEVLVISLNGKVDVKRSDRIQINGFSLVLVMEGCLDVNINGNDNHVNSKAFLDVIDFHAIQNVKMSSDFRGYHVIVKHDFMDETMRGIKRIPIGSLMSHFDCPTMQLDDQEAIMFENIILNMVKNFEKTDHLYVRDLVKNELRSLLMEMSNIIINRGGQYVVTQHNSKEDVVAHFVVLVNKHCCQEHSVSFYANELCVEPKYLSRMLKGMNGKTATQWIDDAIMVKARMMLKDHDLTLQQIADTLHFSDQSAFGKFFKKHCGVSPLTYRRD